jgi:hypothetical protein
MSNGVRIHTIFVQGGDAGSSDAVIGVFCLQPSFERNSFHHFSQRPFPYWHIFIPARL